MDKETRQLKQAIKQESDSLFLLLTDSDAYESDFDFTIQVRNGEIVRSILAKVWNGKEFEK